METKAFRNLTISQKINAGLILFGLIFLLVELPRVSDFKIFLLASEDIGNDVDIYDKWYLIGFKYFYSPLFALLLKPLTLVPDYLAATFWSLLSFGLFIRTFIILHQYIPSNSSRSGMLNTLVVLAGFSVIYASFHNNQMSAYILWSIVESVHLFKKKRWFIASFILALAINIKLLPLVIIPYLIYRKYYLGAALTLAFMVLFLLIPAAFIGWEHNLELLRSYWIIINPFYDSNLIDISEPGLLSISSLISTLFTDKFSLNELEIRRHIYVLPEQTIATIINIVRLVFILFTIYFLRWPPFRSASSKLHELWELAYLAMVIPIIYPHQQDYGFFLIVPALFYVGYQLWFSNVNRGNTLKWIFIIAALTINLGFIFAPYKKVFLNFKVLTYGVLLLCLLLSILNPLKTKTE